MVSLVVCVAQANEHTLMQRLHEINNECDRLRRTEAGAQERCACIVSLHSHTPHPVPNVRL